MEKNGDTTPSSPPCFAARVAATACSLWRRQEGQSLIELALMVPIFTTLVCYSVDFGYFLMVATSMNSAARNTIEFSIQGTLSPSQSSEPSAALLSAQAIGSLGIPNVSTSNVSVQICSSAVGLNAQVNTTQCATPSTGAGSISATLDLDPETPIFQLNRVEVDYNITPPIPIPAAIFPTTKFRRFVEMRAIQ